MQFRNRDLGKFHVIILEFFEKDFEPRHLTLRTYGIILYAFTSTHT
jgi:hypothetical protein